MDGRDDALVNDATDNSTSTGAAVTRGTPVVVVLGADIELGTAAGPLVAGALVGADGNCGPDHTGTTLTDVTWGIGGFELAATTAVPPPARGVSKWTRPATNSIPMATETPTSARPGPVLGARSTAAVRATPSSDGWRQLRS